MARWQREDASKGAKYLREWKTTEKGLEYKKRQAEYAKEWRKNNKDRFKTNQKRAYTKARLETLQHYSGKEVPECACCGEAQFLFLQIDHVNNDGASHRREIGMTQGDANQMAREGRKASIGGNGFVYWLRKNGYPEGFQVLCANCNYAKRHGNVCPHQMQNECERYLNG